MNKTIEAFKTNPEDVLRLAKTMYENSYSRAMATLKQQHEQHGIQSHEDMMGQIAEGVKAAVVNNNYFKKSNCIKHFNDYINVLKSWLPDLKNEDFVAAAFFQNAVLDDLLTATYTQLQDKLPIIKEKIIFLSKRGIFEHNAQWLIILNHLSNPLSLPYDEAELKLALDLILQVNKQCEAFEKKIRTVVDSYQTNLTAHALNVASKWNAEVATLTRPKQDSLLYIQYRACLTANSIMQDLKAILYDEQKTQPKRLNDFNRLLNAPDVKQALFSTYPTKTKKVHLYLLSLFSYKNMEMDTNKKEEMDTKSFFESINCLFKTEKINTSFGLNHQLSNLSMPK